METLSAGAIPFEPETQRTQLSVPSQGVVSRRLPRLAGTLFYWVAWITLVTADKITSRSPQEFLMHGIIKWAPSLQISADAVYEVLSEAVIGLAEVVLCIIRKAVRQHLGNRAIRESA